MSLSLSTTAAPELGLEAFGAACTSRGLDGGELALDPGEDTDLLVARVAASRACIVALRAETLETFTPTELARASSRLGVPVSVPVEGVVLSELSNLIRAFEQVEGRLLLGVGTNLDATLSLLALIRMARVPAAIGLAWEVRPLTESLEEASAMVFATSQHLGLVRLHGGGPEQRAQDGRGVGALLADLALSAYAGPIVLCPSAPETLPQWAKWLTSQKSAGCGSRAEANVLALDVRDVEPRDSLGTILGSYQSLARGAMMKLTVDHDPSCMYYTLQATEAEGSFAFNVVEHGPEVWRAEVTKLV